MNVVRSNINILTRVCLKDIFKKMGSDTKVLTVLLEMFKGIVHLQFESIMYKLMVSFLGYTFGNVHQSSNQLQDKTCCVRHQGI